MIELAGSEVSHCLALSLKDNGNSLSHMASSVTPLYFTLSHNSKKLVKCSCSETEYLRVVVVSQPPVKNYSLESGVCVSQTV